MPPISLKPLRWLPSACRIKSEFLTIVCLLPQLYRKPLSRSLIMVRPPRSSLSSSNMEDLLLSQSLCTCYSLCMEDFLQVVAWLAPCHPSGLNSNVTSSQKSSLIAPSDCCYSAATTCHSFYFIALFYFLHCSYHCFKLSLLSYLNLHDLNYVSWLLSLSPPLSQHLSIRI